MKNKCYRCGNEAVIETIEGWLLCSGCESLYNSIENNNKEERTKEDFENEIKRYAK